MPPLTHVRRLLVVIVLVVVMGGAPAASARPVTNPQCEDSGYRARHPLICDTFTIGGGGSRGGGGGGGGFLDPIRDLIDRIPGLGGIL